jgi:hypothetical protein
VLKKRPLMHPLITEHVSPLKSFLYGYITPLFRSNIPEIEAFTESSTYTEINQGHILIGYLSGIMG